MSTNLVGTCFIYCCSKCVLKEKSLESRLVISLWNEYKYVNKYKPDSGLR